MRRTGESVVQDCGTAGPLKSTFRGIDATKALYCTSGDEGVLREWDAKTLALQREIALEGVSPDRLSSVHFP